MLTLPSLKSQLLREDVNIAIVEEPVIKRGWLTLPSLKSQLLREDVNIISGASITKLTKLCRVIG
jgi:hypothetical protein